MRLAIFALLILVSTLTQAGELQFVANGKAYHFDRDNNRNESNWGAGLYYRFDSDKTAQPFVTVNSFKDSYNNTSNYIGGGYQWRHQLPAISSKLFTDVGLMGFVMTRKDYRDGRPFVGALPFVSIGYDKMAINLAYVPNMNFNETSLVFVQFMFQLDSFGQ